ncbi:MAG: DUF4435 domain-containing protein [Saprospiraceae bacterium]
MSRPITEKINSKLFETKNKLHSKDGQIVRVFVESEDDIPFWSYVFSFFNIKTKISPNSHNLKRGKKTILQQANNTGKYLLICVDSDYDFLLQNATTTSRLINNNPFIFQTYRYSIENYFCDANAFKQIMVEATYNDNEVVDFIDFFESYSTLTFELFCYSVYYRKLYLIDNELFETKLEQQKLLMETIECNQWIVKNQPTEVFKIKDFTSAINLPQKINFTNNGSEMLLEIKAKIQTISNDLPSLTIEEFKNIQSELFSLGLTPKTTYLFVQGHFIEQIVLRLLTQNYSILKSSRFQIVKNSEATEIEKTNQINAYKKHLDTFDLTTALRTHKYYKNSFWYEKIKIDVQNYIKTNF